MLFIIILFLYNELYDKSSLEFGYGRLPPLQFDILNFEERGQFGRFLRIICHFHDLKFCHKFKKKKRRESHKKNLEENNW